MTFDMADFLAPLDPLTLTTAAVIGAALGISTRQRGYPATSVQLFWMLWGGAVFFIPLALLRGVQGSDVWERLASTYILWIVFVVGIVAGSRWRD